MIASVGWRIETSLLPCCAVLVRAVLLQIGSQARLMSLALRKVTANAAKSSCTILFINQLRYKVGALRKISDIAAGGSFAVPPAASSYAERVSC
jgi:RecA/RadA recombinase